MKLLYLSMLALVLAATTALAANFKDVVWVFPSQASKTYPPLPLLEEDSNFPIVSAQGVLALDLGSGMSLYEKNPDELLLPASTTKIMTALVAMDYFPTNLPLKVGPVGVEGQKMGLKTGEQITAGDLLYGLLVFSANDAAEVLAQSYPGGRAMFVNAMNIKARSLGLAKTHFDNPTGLDAVDHLTTAREMILLARYAMTKPSFREIVATKEKEVGSLDGQRIHHLISTNQLLGQVDGVEGIKTGWTEAARENLVTFVDRDGHQILIVLLGSQDRFGETRELIDWLFTAYSWQPVVFPPLLTSN